MSEFSIVVPAHNEVAVLPRLLGRLGAQVRSRGFDVTVAVVANGCTDETATAAQRSWPQAIVVDTPIAGKANALNLGDRELEQAGGCVGPRLYVDADVVVELDALLAVVDALRQPGTLAAAPQMAVDLSDVSWGVRAFYRVWTALPYATNGMIGSGVYGVSDEGRKRWGAFPAIIADDAFARLHFAPHERKTVISHTFTIAPPRDVASLIRIKTRSHLGNLELGLKFPELLRNEEGSNPGGLKKLAAKPWWWAALAVYGWVKFVSRRRAEAKFRGRVFSEWERDETSRRGVAVTATADRS